MKCYVCQIGRNGLYAGMAYVVTHSAKRACSIVREWLTEARDQAGPGDYVISAVPSAELQPMADCPEGIVSVTLHPPERVRPLPVPSAN